MTVIELGTGRLGWHKGERVSDRYGSVGLWPLANLAANELDPAFTALVPGLPFGTAGTLKAEVVQLGTSNHIGDIADGVSPPSDEKRAAIGSIHTLGTGELCEVTHGEYGPYVGVKPDRGPEPPTPQGCPVCGPFSDGNYGQIHDQCCGDGLTPEARAVNRTFYAHEIGGPNAEQLAWRDKLGQKEVDALVAAGRLRQWDTEKRQWVSCPRTAREINANPNEHDSINRMILVEHRCKVLGIEQLCLRCKGNGWVDMEAVERWQAWNPEMQWLDVKVLYLLHEQGVQLYWETA